MDLRDSFFDSLYNMFKEDKDFYFLTSDMWAFSLEKYKETMGDRFINVGIAEQNMINVAAGLAQSGKKVCVYTITPFITERCFEQIKVNICGANLPVIIVGIGSGLTYNYDGFTHHTPYDISLMRNLPNLTVYSPSDPIVNSYVAQKAYENKGPTYVRLDKGDYPCLPEYDCFYFPKPYKDTQPFMKGLFGPYGASEIVIFSTGTNMYDVVEVAEYLTYEKRIFTTFRDVVRIKPFNSEEAIRIIGSSGKVVVVEEQSPTGGLSSMISEAMVEHGVCRPLKKITLPDEFCKIYGSREWLRKQYGLDKESIITTILDWVGELDGKN